jgi:hypothetical protein
LGFFLMFASGLYASSAAGADITYVYSGNSFSDEDCRAAGDGSNCTLAGRVTGSITLNSTIVKPGFTGSITLAASLHPVVAYSLSASGVTLSSDNPKDCLNSGGAFAFAKWLNNVMVFCRVRLQRVPTPCNLYDLWHVALLEEE